MFIDKLIKKVQTNTPHYKKQFGPLSGPYVMKTCESIGTVNSFGSQNQRSFVISDNMTPISRNLNKQSQSANSKLDQELSKIQKMKNLYQSRQMKNKHRTKSIQRSSASGQKSLQKHLLKPSNTPSFNKQIKSKQIQPQNDSACKNLYTQNIIQNSQASNHIYNNKNASKKITYQMPDSSLHIQDNQHHPYEQQHYYNQQSLSQIANVSQQLSRDISHLNLNLKKTLPDIDCHAQHKDNGNGGNTNANDFCSGRSKNQTGQNFSSSFTNCISKQQVMMLVQGFQAKYQNMMKKMTQLEQQNKLLKLSQEDIKVNSQRYSSVLKEQINEKNKILLQLKKQQQQKQQLQNLLKDVLYKRQRERIQSSKENTYRQNQKSQRKLTNFSIMQSQSTCELKQTRNSVVSHQFKQSQSKMKVQNLLNKLQIKVDRV